MAINSYAFSIRSSNGNMSNSLRMCPHAQYIYKQDVWKHRQRWKRGKYQLHYIFSIQSLLSYCSSIIILGIVGEALSCLGLECMGSDTQLCKP